MWVTHPRTDMRQEGEMDVRYRETVSRVLARVIIIHFDVRNFFSLSSL